MNFWCSEGLSLCSGQTPPSLAHALLLFPVYVSTLAFFPVLSSQLLRPDLRRQQGQIPRLQCICAFEGLGIAVIPKLFPFDSVRVIFESKRYLLHQFAIVWEGAGGGKADLTVAKPMSKGGEFRFLIAQVRSVMSTADLKHAEVHVK